jgi:catechol 2,3-dioxygenase-like lactoylglutathione lyase family enzyme
VRRSLTGIDHVILGVRDLDAARARWQRLGFTTTPRGRHVGWGTANYCVMFEKDYVEILGIVDPSAYDHGLSARLAARGEGLMGVVLRSADAAATAAGWRAAGLAPDEPRELGRRLEFGGGQDLRFRNVRLPTESQAGMGLFACEHLTPELVRQSPAWLAHPNGALGLASVTLVVDDPEPIVATLEKIFGSASLTDTDRIIAVQTGTAVILVAPPEDAMLIHEAVAVPEPVAEPLLLDLAIKVGDPVATASFLAGQGVAHHVRSDGSILVAPEAANGVALEFVAAKP